MANFSAPWISFDIHPILKSIWERWHDAFFCHGRNHYIYFSQYLIFLEIY